MIQIFIEQINGSADVKKLNDSQLGELCSEIRAFLIDTVSRTGGHLASNLGVVELTVAIHRVFDTSLDRLVFDVGHQCYVHKILTGRAEGFDSLRSFGGISGFPKPCESADDAFIAGHASNAVSVASGMAKARTLKNEGYNVIALLGDGALTGGLAYEGLNDAGQSGEPLIIILNDNGMSIAENVGGMAQYLARQRVKPSYFRFKKGYRSFMKKMPGGKHIYRITHSVKQALKSAVLPCSMFEDMGFTYLGPVDGHDIGKLTYLLNYAVSLNAPVLVHVCTIKGKGYQFSEVNPGSFHGVGTFEPTSGEPNTMEDRDFSAVFGETLTQIAGEDENVCAITAAMQTGTGLAGFFEKFPERSFDVGIAEQHAVSMAAGMASSGVLPVFAVYSTFLQRAYDMLIHDAAISRLHIVLGVDRAGITGCDGETHQGIFDVPFLCHIPGMKVLCPASFEELRQMLRAALYEFSGPVAVRYPRGGEGEYKGVRPYGPAALMRVGGSITIVTYGTLVNIALKAADRLADRGIGCEVIKLGAISPVDYETIIASVKKTKNLLVLEDCVAEGCVGQRIAAHLLSEGVNTKNLLLKNCGMSFVPHGSVERLYKSLGLDAEGVETSVLAVLGKAEAG